MIHESLWSELFIHNKDFLLKRINEFEKQLDLLKDALSKKDQQALEELMRKSTQKRGEIK